MQRSIDIDIDDIDIDDIDIDVDIDLDDIDTLEKQQVFSALILKSNYIIRLRSLIRDNFQRGQGGPWNGAIEDRITARQGLADRQPSVHGHGSVTRNT